MTNQYAGNYPIENRSGQIERLHTQGAAMAPDTLTMLDRIGVDQGVGGSHADKKRARAA